MKNFIKKIVFSILYFFGLNKNKLVEKIEKPKYYAFVEYEGKFTEFEVDKYGYLSILKRNLKGDLYTNALYVLADNNLLNSITANNCKELHCLNNPLVSLIAPELEILICNNTNLEFLIAPKLEELYCYDTPLKFFYSRSLKKVVGYDSYECYLGCFYYR